MARSTDGGLDNLPFRKPSMKHVLLCSLIPSQLAKMAVRTLFDRGAAADIHHEIAASHGLNDEKTARQERGWTHIATAYY